MKIMHHQPDVLGIPWAVTRAALSFNEVALRAHSGRHEDSRTLVATYNLVGFNARQGHDTHVAWVGERTVNVRTISDNADSVQDGA